MKQTLYACTAIVGFFFLSTKISNAQGVAINNDGSQAAASAMLDVKATDKGMLVPRVALTTVVAAPAAGLLVYQTGGTPGFYYYNGTAWVYLKNSATPEMGTAAGQVVVTGAAPYAATLQPMSGDATIAGNGALTITNNAVTVGKMATSGTLPAFNGSALTNLNASNLSSGTVPVSRLGSSGTPSASTFLNGAGAWAATPVGYTPVTTVNANNVTLSTENQFVFINGNYTVILPANPVAGQLIHIFSESGSSSINPNGKVFRQANNNYGTSMLTEFGNSATRNMSLIYDGVRWYPLM